jgi:RNA polymerase sigma factor (sigma-70 family)
MRLARFKRSPEGADGLIRETLRPGHVLARESDLAQLFVETYERLRGQLLDHAERFVGKDDAQDAVGEAVASLWIQWSTLPQEKRNDAYIFGVVRHCVSAKRREYRMLVSLEDAEAELDGRAVRAAQGADDGNPAAELLDATLDAMPTRRREVVLLVRGQSFTRREAADAIGVSVDTIGTHMRLAMDDLRAEFRRAGFRIANLRSRRLPWPKQAESNE